MLKNKINDADWPEATEDDYILVTDSNGNNYQIMFLCPGCKKLIGIATPPWKINFELLTARESILHTPPHGCGWHGYLTRGILSLDCPPTNDV